MYLYLFLPPHTVGSEDHTETATDEAGKFENLHVQ